MQKYLDVTGAAIYIKALVYKRISQIQLFNGDVEVISTMHAERK